MPSAADTALPEVVFILSTNYAGSHLLAQLLAAHSRCAGVGELHNYRKFRERGSRSGNVVNDYLQHPAFAGLDETPVTEWHRRILLRLRQDQPGLTHLIDNSKRLAWLQRFPPAHAHPVHLLRDPRALIWRWQRTYETDAAVRRQRLRVLRHRPWRAWSCRRWDGLYLEKWLLANQAMSRYVRRRGGSQVTYRDLAVCSAEVLGQLMPQLGLDYEPGQLAYGSAAVTGTRKRDWQEAAARSEIRIDLRWQSELEGSVRRRVETHPRLQRYLREQGLIMGADGLHARSLGRGG